MPPDRADDAAVPASGHISTRARIAFLHARLRRRAYYKRRMYHTAKLPTGRTANNTQSNPKVM
jgi:hypothetical protein